MKLTAWTIAAVIGVAAAGSAEAMPASSLAAPPSSTVTLVRDGCGFGAHQGALGGCRLNHGWRGRLRGREGGAPLGCPPGTHPTGRGFCRRNGF